MSDVSTYFLDACVPMYAAGRGHSYREPCLRILEAVAGGAVEAVTDTEVIQEIVYRYHAVGRIADGRQVAESFLEAVETVLPVTRREAARFLALQRAYPLLLPRDAIHVAVMEAAGLSRIVTADRHFGDLPGIERVDPADLAAAL